MTDHAQRPLTVAEAVEAIHRATAFTEPLRRRSEGVTIALWGLVTACILLSGSLLDHVYGFYDAGGWRRIVSSFLWLPWAVVGVAGTLAVWRIAEVSAGRREPGRRRSPAAILAWFAVLVALALVIAVFSLATAGLAIAVLGLFWLATGALDLYKATPTGRRTLLVIGSLIVLVGAVYGWVSRDWPTPDAWHGFYPVATLTAGVVPILGGLWQALRG